MCSFCGGNLKKKNSIKCLDNNYQISPLFVISSCPPQVSAEPDGSSYVFQGFIQGKDYGQFGLQRLGNCLLKEVTAPSNYYDSCKSRWIFSFFVNDTWKTQINCLREPLLMKHLTMHLKHFVV